MATEKTLKARLLMKTDTSANWSKATNFIPKAGEIIIYSDDERKIKVGDGLTKVSSLKFVNQDELAKITTLGDELLAVKNDYVPNTRTINSKPLSANISLTASDVGAATSSHTHSYLPLSGGTVTGTLTVNKELYNNAAVISKRNSSPQFILQNANGAQLGTFYSTSSDGSYGNVAIAVNKDNSSAAYYTFSNFGRFSSPRDIQTITFRAKSDSNPDLVFLNNNETILSQLYVATTDGSYGNVLLKVLSSATKASYFTFKNDGIFSAPSDIISNGGMLKSSKDNRPTVALTNASGAWLAGLSAYTTDGTYGDVILTVNSSATESKSFTFSNQGSFRAPSTVYSSLFAAQSNNNPQLMLQNASGAPLGMLYMNTTTGGYSSAYLRVYSSASAYSTFNFGNDGKLSCGSLALATALPISSGGTGSTTASGALTNLGALPLTGGTLTGTLTATALYASDGDVTGVHLITKTNNYPEIYFKNAAGTTLADFYVDTTSGGFADVRLKVFSDASTAKYFTFGKNGVFGIPNSFSTMMGEFKNDAWPQLFFRNGNGDALAQLVIPTDNGSYSGLTVNVFSDANSHVEYKFNSDGTFTAPAGITTTGNYVSIKNNSYPQLTFSNASGADLGKVFVSTTDGSYAATKIRAYSSASAYYDFQFSGEGTFNAKEFQVTGGLAYLIDYNSNAGVLGLGNTTYGDFTEISCDDDGALSINDALRATTLRVDGLNDWPSIFFKCKSKTNPGVLLQASSNHGFGIYCYGSDLDTATTRYFEGYTFPTPATGLTANKSYTVYSEKNIIYSSSQPTGVKGAIWLKPV